MAMNQQQQQQQRGMPQSGVTGRSNPGPQTGQNLTLVPTKDNGTLPSVLQSGVSGQNRTIVPTKKIGTPAVVPQSKKIARTKEEDDVEIGVRAGEETIVSDEV